MKNFSILIKFFHFVITVYFVLFNYLIVINSFISLKYTRPF